MGEQLNFHVALEDPGKKMAYIWYMIGIWSVYVWDLLAIELVKFDQPNCMEMLPSFIKTSTKMGMSPAWEYQPTKVSSSTENQDMLHKNEVFL